MKHLTIIGILITIVGCDYAQYHSPIDGDQGGQKQTCEELGDGGTIPSYDQVLNQVFAPKCAQCHNTGRASGGVNVTNYNGAKAWANQIEFDVVNDIMPKSPNPPLSQAEKDLVVAWTSAGAPLEAIDCASQDPPPGDGGGGGGGGNDPGPIDPPSDQLPPDDVINFELVKQEVFSARCLGCHSNTVDNFTGIILDNYTDAIDELDDLQEVIVEGSMPPPPRPRLTQFQANLLLRWIEIGAPN